MIAWGSHAHLERYITPQRGLGYWLGITGGSMMLLLLIYSARKRFAWLRWLGGIPAWFEIHMMLGVVGPLLVLFHANFHLGATNSNVALICMLVVAGSGVVGRYIYTRLHAHLDGNEDTLEQLKAVGERLRSQTTSISFLPGLLDGIDRVEERWIAPPKGLVRRFFHLITGGPRGALARWQVHREIKHAVEKAAQQESTLIARHAQSHRRGGAPLRRPAPGGRPACRGISDVRAAVFALARAAHSALLHAVDRRHRPRRCHQRVLT